MAKREALRELQSRLAERLQAVRTEARIASWLAVESAGTGFLVPLPTAGEIFPFGSVLRVPHTRPWYVGLANLRGGLHGVVDLAAFLGLRPTMSAPEPLRDHASMVALNPAFGVNCALLVEKLLGLRNAEQMQAEDSAPAAQPAFAGGRWRDAEGRVWQELDLAALAQTEDFLAIVA